MKAVVYRRFGSPDCLAVEEIERPTPGDHEVLIAVHAAALNALDWHRVKGSPYPVRLLLGMSEPKRIGVDVSGRIEAIGNNVTRFKPGDEVFGSARGAVAEYVSTRESALALKPQSVTFAQASSVAVAGLTALQGLRDHARVARGQKILINGAAGGVGTFTVQIGRALGVDVTGVCSAGNVELVRSLGADRVIDYTHEDFTSGPSRYDAILDCVGNHSWAACRRVLTPTGRYIVVGGPPLRALRLWVASRFFKRGLGVFVARVNPADLDALRELLASGDVKPAIDQCYPFAEAAAALRHLATGHARGKVVISVIP